MADYNLVLRGGAVLDGSGGPPWVGDVAIVDDRIVAMGRQLTGAGEREIDVSGLVLAPGFINMMSWAPESLIEDGRSMSDILQGVTLEVMGEGSSMGPLNDSMKADLGASGLAGTVDGYRYNVGWTTLCEYLEWLESRGVSTNIASLVGAGTLRVHEIGFDDRAATSSELERMCALLDDEMGNGALGLGSALIYPPETVYRTDELVALSQVVSRHGGLYASHIRSEGANLLDAVDELIEIARRADVRAEVYHLKAAGQPNWANLDRAIAAIEYARRSGLSVTADMYPYHYSGTSLTACFPSWAHEGGVEALRARLRDRVTRDRIARAMTDTDWENAFLDAGPDNITISGSLAAHLVGYLGKTLSEIAQDRAVTAEETAMDLVLENEGDVFALYFDMSLENVRRVMTLPWVSFCSDAESLAAEGRALTAAVHPRAYGAFARVLGRHVRDEQLISLPEAVRRMTSLPADNLRLRDRGRLRVGCYADVVAFDPARVEDHATPTDPHRYASGVEHVLVNGTPVVVGGAHTGAMPGRFVRGPGWRGR
jgi:N-acyl-D-amino-acid deacylase